MKPIEASNIAQSSATQLPWKPYPAIPAWAAAGVSGHLVVVASVFSPELENRRRVLVYLPPSYGQAGMHFPVLYMQDGQNLFDPATAFGGQSWQVGETMSRLAQEGREAIVVAVDHMDALRIAEYNPFAAWQQGQGEQYVRFLTDTLKPAIDHDFHTRPGRSGTAILGSSMGGLISLYAAVTRPEIFGMAGVMSPSLWVAGGAIRRVVAEHARPGSKFYLDSGSHESSAAPMRDLLLTKGFQPGHDLMYLLGRGDRHTESAWARRLPNALRFLLRSESWLTD